MSDFSLSNAASASSKERKCSPPHRSPSQQHDAAWQQPVNWDGYCVAAQESGTQMDSYIHSTAAAHLGSLCDCIIHNRSNLLGETWKACGSNIHNAPSLLICSCPLPELLSDGHSPGDKGIMDGRLYQEPLCSHAVLPCSLKRPPQRSLDPLQIIKVMLRHLGDYLQIACSRLETPC